MKFINSVIAVLALVLLSAGVASAQNGVFAPYVNVNLSVTGTGAAIGTSNPNYRIGGGIESSTKHLLFDANGQFDSASLTTPSLISLDGGVVNNQGGYTGTFTASAYYKLGGVVLVGAGVSYSNQVLTGQALFGEYGFNLGLNRNQIRPFVGVGLNLSRDRIIVNYVLPGKDRLNTGGGIVGEVLGSNVVTGFNDRTINVQNEIILAKSGLFHHIRLTQNVSVSTSNVASVFKYIRTEGVTAGVGVKFVL
jgi:hypothetical protein